MKIRNEPRAMPAGLVVEGIYVIQASNTNEAITANEVFFQQVWLYPAKAAVAGVMTANGAIIYLGLSGLAAGTTPYLPDKRAAADTDYPVVYAVPLGMKMALSQVIVRGTAGDGVFYRYI